jgi:hypothetical protein
MRSIEVPLELTVSLVNAVEGVENTNTVLWLVTLGLCKTALPQIELTTFCSVSGDLGRWRHTMIETASIVASLHARFRAPASGGKCHGCGLALRWLASAATTH